MPVAAKTSLDSFDRKILDCLQDEADMPLAEIARKVGLSTTPCWRRINRLQADGVIRARVALLDRRALNAGVTVFVAVRTAQHNAQWLTRFAKAVASFPEVMDCYRMSGEIDYLIRLALPDQRSIQGTRTKHDVVISRCDRIDDLGQLSDRRRQIRVGKERDRCSCRE